MGTSKYIGDAEVNGAQIEVGECACGYHFGVDSTYLETAEMIRKILGKYWDLSLYSVLREKMAYNASRPYRHGNKKA